MKVKAIFLWAIVPVALCAVSIVGIGAARGWFTATSRQAVGAPMDERLEVELITLRRFGFEPAAITRSSKGFLLKFANRTNLPLLALSLNQVQQNRPSVRLLETNLIRGRLDWATHLNLAPGEYELTEASRPEWKCRITVTAP